MALAALAEGAALAARAAVLAAGCGLRRQEAACAAAAGYGGLACYKRPGVAVFSTGDEIIRPGEALEPGQVYDANAPMLRGLIEAAGAQCIDLGVLQDERQAVQSSLEEAAAKYDAVITSGGASQGDEDHVVDALDALGSLHMWQIAIKDRKSGV